MWLVSWHLAATPGLLDQPGIQKPLKSLPSNLYKLLNSHSQPPSFWKLQETTGTTRSRYVEIHWMLKSALQLSARANVKIDECVLDWKILSCQCQYCHDITIAVIATHEKTMRICHMPALTFQQKTSGWPKRFFLETKMLTFTGPSQISDPCAAGVGCTHRGNGWHAPETHWFSRSLLVFSQCVFLDPKLHLAPCYPASVIFKFCQHTEVPTSGGACSLVPWEYRRYRIQYRYCCDSVLPRAPCFVALIPCFNVGSLNQLSTGTRPW